MEKADDLFSLCRLVRYDIITSTTQAGSGHPSSSLSAVELAVTIFFGGFSKPGDRFILSKGHASPLLYSLYHAAGKISTDELLTLRHFGSRLEGHPTPRFPGVDVATGSLGQGLSVGIGLALAGTPHVYVLLGDSEMAEGQIWEAIQIAAYYQVANLTGIIDVNRLGQRGPTMLGWDIDAYAKRIGSFGWETVVIDDGHDIDKIKQAYRGLSSKKPTMIIAKTVKGKGVSLFENQEGWHGKVVPKEKLAEALQEIGEIKPEIIPPECDFLGEDKQTVDATGFTASITESDENRPLPLPPYKVNDIVSIREAYGDGLVAAGTIHQEIVALDAEMSNSTYAAKFKERFPERFFEMYIAEQNMVSTALGMSKRGRAPFASTFAAFFSRAFDQIRMAQYSNANLKLVGSHAGVFIGQDGPSQMALEDIAMLRSILASTVLYPGDATAGYKLVEEMYKTAGIVYLRTTHQKLPVIYPAEELFFVGGSKIHGERAENRAVIVAAGVTLHQALQAQKELQQQNVSVAVIDLYSVKPLDQNTLLRFTQRKIPFLVVEDHYPVGGLGDAVRQVIFSTPLIHLSVKKRPQSGESEELLRYEEIDTATIKKQILSFI
ncbi:transketolase [Candidatus Roizmanbacteria bacterium]|nr:transketolase [Candidatus Roizmanbacteria bacterium]